MEICCWQHSQKNVGTRDGMVKGIRVWNIEYEWRTVMRLHYLWPQKSQNCTIPVNLEAIWTTTIASKLFRPLYLGYNRVLHYIVYGLRLSNFDISLASLDLSVILKYILKKLNYLWLPKSSTRTASYALDINCSMFLAFNWSPQMVSSSIAQDQYHLTQYFQDNAVYFGHHFILTLILARSRHPDLFVPGSDFLGHHFRILVYSDVVFWCYSEGKGIISKLVDLLVKAW